MSDTTSIDDLDDATNAMFVKFLDDPDLDDATKAIFAMLLDDHDLDDHYLDYATKAMFAKLLDDPDLDDATKAMFAKLLDDHHLDDHDLDDMLAKLLDKELTTKYLKPRCPGSIQYKDEVELSLAEETTRPRSPPPAYEDVVHYK